MTKLTFKAIYEATKEGIKALKEPIVRQRNIRGCDSAIDSAEEIIMNTEDDLEKEYSVINEGKVINYNRVLELRQRIKDAQATIEELKLFKSEFFQ
jgi:predicted S18 family serine protease